MSTSHSVNAPKAHETTPSGDARSQAKQANRLAIMDAARTLFVDKGDIPTDAEFATRHNYTFNNVSYKNQQLDQIL